MKPRQQLLIRGQWGLGDNIYARPFVRELANKYELFLDTPWPEIYEDLDVKFILRPRNLRTQMKNVARQKPGRWSQMPRLYVNERQISYGAGELPRLSIPKVLEQKFGVKADWASWDLPRQGANDIKTEKPVAVVKATTERREWKSQSRNPRPEYVNWLAEQLLESHTVIAVGDVDGEAETLVGGIGPRSHTAFIKGELPVEELIALVGRADIIVGGVGWNVPMSIALKVKSFVVLGGRGGHNAPEVITDPAMDLSRIGFATPDKYCRCSSALHNCNKTISNLAAQWANYCARVGLGARAAVLNGGPSASVSIPPLPASHPMIKPTSTDLAASHGV